MTQGNFMIEQLRNFIQHTFAHLIYAIEDMDLSILDQKPYIPKANCIRES